MTPQTSSLPVRSDAPGPAVQAASCFKCPRCAGDLAGSAAEFSCARCAERYPIRDGIIDFRCGRHDYYFNPVPRPAMQELIAGAPDVPWDDTVRRFLGSVRAVKSWIDNVAVSGRYSWKLFLELPPDARLLDLGCGLGNLTQNLAPHVGETVALDLTWERLQFAQQRFAKFNAGQHITLVAGGDGPHLPFPDGYFDSIALSGVLEWIPSDSSVYRDVTSPVSKALRMLMSFFGDSNPRRTQIRFLQELRRILNPHGQLFVAIENRWSYEYFTGRPDHHSGLKYGSLLPRFAANVYSLARKHKPYRTYTYSFTGLGKLFTAAGLPHQQRLGLTPGYSGLEEIIPLAGVPAAWTPAPAAAGAERVKRSRFFVPAFGIAAKGDATQSASLLDRVVGEVQASHPELGHLTFHHCVVTGKEKVVLSGVAGGQPVILKIPASPEALAGELNNRSFLDRLAMHASVAGLVPRPLAHGVHQNLPYFLETAANGVPLEAASDGYRVAAAAETGAVLYRLRSLRVTRRTIEKNDDVYVRLVSAPLAKLRAAGIAGDQCARLEGRLYSLLASATWPIGLSHGDFSMHNLFFSAHRVSGIIDWGDATFDGLPILDALAYVQSMQRKWSKKPRPRVGETLKRLAAWDWPSREEVSLLRRIYEETQIDVGLHPALCELCWLQHMSSQLDSPNRFNRDAMLGKSQPFLQN